MASEEIRELRRILRYGRVKVADDVAKAVIAESRGIDLSDAHEGMALFHGFQDCFAYLGGAPGL
jgi:hypothetical protein